jgi:hypothetical protein
VFELVICSDFLHEYSSPEPPAPPLLPQWVTSLAQMCVQASFEVDLGPGVQESQKGQRKGQHLHSEPHLPHHCLHRHLRPRSHCVEPGPVEQYFFLLE